MRIKIRARHFELTDALRETLERRVRLALARFEQRVDSVTVRIEERVAAAAGDARYVCRVAIVPTHDQIQEEHDRLQVAIDRAIDRATRLTGSLRDRPTHAPRGGT